MFSMLFTGRNGLTGIKKKKLGKWHFQLILHGQQIDPDHNKQASTLIYRFTVFLNTYEKFDAVE